MMLDCMLPADLNTYKQKDQMTVLALCIAAYACHSSWPCDFYTELHGIMQLKIPFNMSLNWQWMYRLVLHTECEMTLSCQDA